MHFLALTLVLAGLALASRHPQEATVNNIVQRDGDCSPLPQGSSSPSPDTPEVFLSDPALQVSCSSEAYCYSCLTNA